MSTDPNSDDRVTEEEERSLRALFDETAPPPDPAALSRMARAAAQIPERRLPWYRRLWSRQPALVGAVVAAAAALALVFAAGDDEPQGGPVASGSAPITSPDPAPTLAQSAEVPVVDDIDELLAFDVADDGFDEVATLDADPLAGWDGSADSEIIDEHPMSAFELLLDDDADDIELLATAFDDVLTEGG
jgi:hypothetical protein